MTSASIRVSNNSFVLLLSQSQSNRSGTQSSIRSHPRAVLSHASQELKKRDNSRDIARYKVRMSSRNKEINAENEQNSKRCEK